MKVVLDTNVIIAAFAVRGLCNDVLEICVAEHEIILSGYIISEVRKNLEKKIKLPEAVVKDIIGYLETEALSVSPADIPASACRDKDDLGVIAAAVSGKADIIISGDNDLISIKKYKSIKILTPREFWGYLSK